MLNTAFSCMQDSEQLRVLNQNISRDKEDVNIFIDLYTLKSPSKKTIEVLPFLFKSRTSRR